MPFVSPHFIRPYCAEETKKSVRRQRQNTIWYAMCRREMEAKRKNLSESAVKWKGEFGRKRMRKQWAESERS